MGELEKILLTSSLTILGGVFVYAVGQIISKFFIDPIHRQGEIVGEIADALIYYAQVWANPGGLRKELLDEASGRFRQLASLLRSKSYMIKWYELLQSLKLVPELSKVGEASSSLIGLSNSLYNLTLDEGVDNFKRVEEIKKLLGIPSPKG